MDKPLLRFDGYTKNWNSRQINSVFDLSAGGDVDFNTFSKEKDDEHPYPIFANSVLNHGLYGYSSTFKEEGKCITVTGRGVNVGYAEKRLERFTPIVRLLTLRPKETIDLDFFRFVLNHHDFFIETTGIPQLTAPQCGSETIKVPDIDEQKAIAEFLLNLEDQINNCRQVIKKWRQIREHKLRSYYDLHVNSTFTVDNVLSFQKKTKHSCSSGKEEGEYRFFTSGSDVKKYNSYDFDGEYIICNDGGAASFDFASSKFAVSDHCIVLGLKDNHFRLKYVYYYLKRTERLIDYAGFVGTGLKNIDKDWFKEFPIPFVNIDKQNEIIESLEEIDKFIDDRLQQLFWLKQRYYFYTRSLLIKK